jgi:molecular chaperone DnaK
MHQRQYTLGLDIGDATVVAAVRTGDDDDPGRSPQVFPGHPRHPLGRIGSASPLYRDGRQVDPADAVAALARQAADQAAPADDATFDWTVLTVPPSWGDHRRDLLVTALRAAGLDRFSLESSAVAVASHHRRLGTLPEGAPVVVVDVGASTVDTAVVRVHDDRVETVAMPPAPLGWGGRDLDDAVVELVSGCLAAEDGPAVSPSEVKRASVAAKEALSTDAVAEVVLARPGGSLCLRLVREDLEDLVAEPLQAVVAAVRRTIAEAGLEPAEVGAIVLSGGTAAVPLVAETLSAELDRPVVVDGEPALTAARGAAELAAVRPPTEDAAEPAAEPLAPAAPVTVRPARRRTTPTGPSAGGRPPARSGSRPPAPSPSPHTQRRVVRVGVVLSAFVAIVVGVAAAASLGWTGSPADRAASAGTAVPERTGAPDAGSAASDPGSGGLSPAAAEGRPGSGSGSGGGSGSGSGSGDRDDDATAGSAASGTSPSRASAAASTSRSGSSSSAATGTTAGTAGPRNAPASGAASSSAPAGSGSAAPAGQAAPNVPPSGPPTPADPPPADPSPVDPAPVDPAPSDPAPADPAPVDPAPADPASADPPPADPAPVEDPAPEPAPAPAPASPPAQAVAA